jgi:hypothetical protein
MPRRRSLSPEFFKDEDLATLPFEARLLFQGLWCYADRDGRLEDRPKYLKAEIFPYDKVDVEKLLCLLASPQCSDRPTKVFIHRYVADDRNYLEIPEFTKHQSPHHTEHHSRIPEFNGALTVKDRLKNSVVQDAHYPISDPISDQGPETRAANTSKKKRQSRGTHPLPPDFCVSEAVKAWGVKEGHTLPALEAHLERFRDYALSNGKEYKDWDAAFRRAVRENWGKLGSGPTINNGIHPPPKAEPQPSWGRTVTSAEVWFCGCYRNDPTPCKSPDHGKTYDEAMA